MSFNSNIPQSTDLISVSQQDLLNNFTSMQSTYTTDHYGFNPVTNLGFHKQITLANDPAITRTTASGNGVEYASTINSATYPFWQRDNTGTVYTLLPIKAFGLFTASNPPVSTFTLPYGNVTSITRVSAGVYNLTFTDAFPNSSYGALCTVNNKSNFNIFAHQNGTTTGQVEVTLGAGHVDSGDLIMVAFIF